MHEIIRSAVLVLRMKHINDTGTTPGMCVCSWEFVASIGNEGM